VGFNADLLNVFMGIFTSICKLDCYLLVKAENEKTNTKGHWLRIRLCIPELNLAKSFPGYRIISYSQVHSSDRTLV